MILQGDCAKVLKDFDFNCIDLTVTSPPYDNLRYYDGHNKIDIVTIAKELLRVTKRGGICVWVVSDQTVDFNESLTSLEHARTFQSVGWKVHDTMMFLKNGTGNLMENSKRYSQAFEFMFVFCKGYVKKFNPIKDIKNKTDGHHYRSHSPRNYKDQIIYDMRRKRSVNEYGIRSNVWTYDIGYLKTTKDIIAYNHPATFPELLVFDHIRSWSNVGDYVLDPFLGSGTTYKMALKLNRIPIGIEINPKYIKIAKRRLTRYLNQKKEFGKLLN